MVYTLEKDPFSMKFMLMLSEMQSGSFMVPTVKPLQKVAFSVPFGANRGNLYVL